MTPHKSANLIDSIFEFFISVKPDRESQTYKKVYEDTTKILKDELDSYRRSPRPATQVKENPEK